MLLKRNNFFKKKQFFIAGIISIILNNVYVQANEFAIYTMGLTDCRKTFLDFGAKGDNKTDDTLSLQAALDSNCDIDGQNLNYVVNGVLTISHDILLKNAYFRQIQLDKRIKTLYKEGGRVIIKNVRVNRGVFKRNGSVEHSAGIFLNNVSDSILDNIGVTGNGYGQGIFILNSHNVLLKYIQVYDLYWSTATPPKYEQAIGIRVQLSNDVIIEDSVIRNILGETGSNIFSTFQSDGITLTGTTNSKIRRVFIEKTGEGIDLTGSSGNIQFEISDSEVVDVDSFAYKFANSAKNGTVKNSIARRAGYAGFIFSGPVEEGLPHLTENIYVNNCHAYNTGNNPRWVHLNVSGFFVMSGSFNTDYPKRITITNSSAINDSEYKNMLQFGFISQTNGNYVKNINSINHVQKKNMGFYYLN